MLYTFPHQRLAVAFFLVHLNIIVSSIMPPDFYQYGTEDPSKMSCTPAPKEEPHKEPVTYTYVPPQAAPKEPNPEPPKTPMTFTYLPPQTMQHPCAAPFMAAPLCSPMGMMMAPVTYMPMSCDVFHLILRE